MYSNIKNGRTQRSSVFSLLPRHLNFSAIVRTIPQIEIDKGLIRDSICCRHRLKIIYCAAINVNSDLLFQATCIGIFSRVQFPDIIFISHKITSNSIKVSPLLSSGCSSCRNNTNNIFMVTVAMAHDTNLFCLGFTDNKKSLFIIRVIRIIKQNGELVVKNLLCRFEG